MDEQEGSSAAPELPYPGIEDIMGEEDTNAKTTRKNSSNVWLHFDKFMEGNVLKAKCRKCQVVYVVKGTSNCKKHLEDRCPYREKRGVGVGISRNSQRNAIQVIEPVRHRELDQFDECLLLAELKNLNKAGWKVGNNKYKDGYIEELGNAMRKRLPDRDICQEHISSKISAWKRDYQTLNKLFSSTVFGLDSSTHEIVVKGTEAWEAYEKDHPEVKGMWHRTFPFYNSWKESFGEDEATGEPKEDPVNSTDPINRANDVLNSWVENQAAYVNTSNAVEKDGPCLEDETSSHDKNNASGTKRKSPEFGEEPLKKLKGDLVCYQNETLKTCLNIKKVQEPSRASVMYTLLESIPDLSLEQRVKVARKLVKETQELELFIALPGEARTKLVELIIREMF